MKMKQAPEVDNELEQQVDREILLARLDAFGQSLAKTRSEAIAARESSGCESDWREDEEFYEGIDDANRSESRRGRMQKPSSSTTTSEKTETKGSTVFPNITRPYVDMASARIADMLMPTDDRAFAIEPTPISDLIRAMGDEPSAKMLSRANELFPQDPEKAQEYLAEVKLEAEKIQKEAKQKSDAAQERIDDWLTECRYDTENRRVIEDAAKIGCGILKGPFPELKTVNAFIDGQLVTEEKIVPVSKRIDYWNFYPSEDCGESIHSGSYTWERDTLTRNQVRELKGMGEEGGYIDENIDLCLDEGPQKATKTYKDQAEQNKDTLFEVWYYHGTAEREDLEAGGMEFTEEDKDPHAKAMVMLINNHVVKVALNPLDTGKFPYDVMVWQRKDAHWTGIGVARQIRTPQRIVTAGLRRLMNNSGKASNPPTVFASGVTRLGDGPMNLAGGNLYILDEDSNIKDARAAAATIKIEMFITELMEIINLGLRLAEDVTGMPMLLQGQLGNAPDTVGGMEMLFNSASSVLRRLARLYDDLITEPHVGRYYEWLLQHGEDDSEKGDFVINARGSTALVEKSMQNQELQQVIQMSQNPSYKIDPAKAVAEFLKSRHLNPDSFAYDDEDWEKIVQQIMQPQSADPRTEIAQANLEFKAQDNQAEREFKAQNAEADRQLKQLLAKFDADTEMELAAMSADGDKALSMDNMKSNIDKLKAGLAEAVMKINAQREMANVKTPMPQIANPIVEPVGKAKPGFAYQQ